MKYDLELDININTSHALMLQRIKENSRVLEFGSASGYMTKYLKNELNCEVTCVEIDTEAAAKAEIYAHKMIVADLEMLDQWTTHLTGVYDYILFADVLEHLRNPKKVLEMAVSFLETNGTVMTSVPNISHNAIIMELLQGKFDYQSTGLLDDTHVHFFTRKSVFDILEDCDLSVVEWLTTLRTPESTEFHQSYEQFPVNVSQYLKSRKDGDVYQYVTISQKSAIVDAAKKVSYEVDNGDNYLDLDQCQIYLQQRGEYLEENSLFHSVKADNEYLTYQFRIPIEHTGDLRIDPCNDISIITIDSIRLLSDAGVVHFESNADNGFRGVKQFNNIYVFNQSVHLEMLSLNHDPGFIIDTKEVDFENNVTLEIKMKMINDLEYILNTIYMKIDEIKQQQVVKDVTIHEQEKVISAKQIELQQQTAYIADLKNQLTQHQTTIANITEQNNQTEKTLNELLNSKSWRLTSVFRKIFGNFKS